MVKQYKIKLDVVVVVTVDESENDLDSVLSEMDYDFNVHPETDHAEIVDTEIRNWEILEEKSDTIKL